VLPTVVRAEQLLDSALLWAVSFGTVVSRRLRRNVARAKEELEDLVAEADALRQEWKQEWQRVQRATGQSRSTDES
jgi:predicted phage tail protein